MTRPTPPVRLLGSWIITLSLITAAIVAPAMASPPAVVSPISPDEPMAAVVSLDRAEAYLARAATSWTESRQCLTCHTNGLYLLSGAPEAEALRQTQRFARESLQLVVEDPQQENPPTRSVEGIVATTAMLAISESRTDGKLAPITRRAFDYLWTIQDESGCWKDWLKCNWPPYEVDDHFGVTLVTVALGSVPPSYRQTPEAQEGLNRLRHYLSEHPPETLHQAAMLLWASSVIEGILTDSEREQVICQLFSCQQRDGGWNLMTLGAQPRPFDPLPETWIRTDGKSQDWASSDGYATGFATYVLQQAGVNRDDPRILRAIAWLKAHQRASGRWFTRSPRRDSRHYISHAGTSFAVMALKAWQDRSKEIK